MNDTVVRTTVVSLMNGVTNITDILIAIFNNTVCSYTLNLVRMCLYIYGDIVLLSPMTIGNIAGSYCVGSILV